MAVLLLLDDDDDEVLLLLDEANEPCAGKHWRLVGRDIYVLLLGRLPQKTTKSVGN